MIAAAGQRLAPETTKKNKKTTKMIQYHSEFQDREFRQSNKQVQTLWHKKNKQTKKKH